MDTFNQCLGGCALLPLGLMLLAAIWPLYRRLSDVMLWRALVALSAAAAVAAVFVALIELAGIGNLSVPGALEVSPFGSVMAALVQVLGTVIAGFSARYLQGETGQRRYMSNLAGVLAGVHLLILADHWVLLITAWALVGWALEQLLCFYPDRPFALLAAHKKRIADRIADLLLIGAALLAWGEVGSGSLSDLWTHVALEGMSVDLQLCAVVLVLAVVLRTALLPVHGWLIQVMEAPTPVSALLHAGVVNLGGFVLIRFAPLLNQAIWARSILFAFGVGTAVLAGMVMLTRISIKVRLAWSTVAQMGFMLLECALGLYTLPALHLVGHSLYKAHVFLSASSVVRQVRLQGMRSLSGPAPISLLIAPVVSIGLVMSIERLFGHAAWPWWWSAMLGLAWAPVMWMSAERLNVRTLVMQCISGLSMVVGLTSCCLIAHTLPWGIKDAPHDVLGPLALLAMFGLYGCLVILNMQPLALKTWRRWSYAGFYVDEAYTRFALQVWPSGWLSSPSDNLTIRRSA